MGRVLFTAKAEPAKAEPAIDWSEIESRLQAISAPIRPSDIPAQPSMPITDDPLAATPSDDVVSLSPYRDIFSEFQAAADASASPP